MQAPKEQTTQNMTTGMDISRHFLSEANVLGNNDY